MIQGKSLPEKAIPFREGDTISAAFLLGAVLSLPIMIPMIIASLIRFFQLDSQWGLNLHFFIAAALTVFSMQLLTYVHEFIHAALYPKEAVKTIWKDKKHGAYFVYCDAKVSKTRFIILCLAPAVILGILPFFLWLAICPILSTVWRFFTMILTWAMTFMAIGDYANVFNAVRQVPKEAKIFNYGVHSYWIKD